jgi:hypothetical protein
LEQRFLVIAGRFRLSLGARAIVAKAPSRALMNTKMDATMFNTWGRNQFHETNPGDDL